jgi:hypothetical protein
MDLLEDFSNVGFGETSVLVRPALDAQWGLEMLSREDAIIAAGVASGRLTAEQRFQLAETIGSQQHIYRRQGRAAAARRPGQGLPGRAVRHRLEAEDRGRAEPPEHQERRRQPAGPPSPRSRARSGSRASAA